jgi:hypothetical protein
MLCIGGTTPVIASPPLESSLSDGPCHHTFPLDDQPWRPQVRPPVPSLSEPLLPLCDCGQVALLCWLHCDILVVFVDNSRKDVLANIMVQLPSLGDISPDRNVDAVD